MGRKKTGKFIFCERCNKKFYVARYRILEGVKYCSPDCFHNNTIPWNKGLTKETDERLKEISEKTSQQMHREYANGTRDRFEITKKANEHVRLHGLPKLRGRKHTEEYKRKLRESCKGINKGKSNGMWGKKPWNKLYPTKKWWEEKEFVELRKECLRRDENKCVKCGVSNVDLYCDHIVPYRICKEHKLNNLQMLCGSCHGKKTVEDVKLFIKNKIFINKN